MKKVKVVVDKDIPFIRGVLEEYAEVSYLEGAAITKNDILDADALIVRTRTKCRSALLEGTRVRFIASATIGYDHIDTAYCGSRSIYWTNAPGCNSSSVQQYIAAALFQLADRGKFRLAGKAIGILGVGNVGSKVEKICRALDMKVLLNDPPRARQEGRGEFLPLNRVLEGADILTLHVPLNRAGVDKTLQMVDESFLRGLRRGAILINSSRGEVVQTQALKEAITAGRISACVLDVWENEPTIDLGLLSAADIGTPHIAGYSADGKANGTAMSVRSFSRFFGLNLDDWYPPEMPVPENTLMEIDCRGLSPEDVLARAAGFTYDLVADDRRLRALPEAFERQRAEYPLRREFPTYELRLVNAARGVFNAVREFGFRIS